MDSSGVQALKGSWDYVCIRKYSRKEFYFSRQVDGENFDEYMKEIGVGWALRMVAKGLKPRLIISEAGDKWTLRSESSVKTVTYDFTPGVEFDETTADGRQVKVNYLDY